MSNKEALEARWLSMRDTQSPPETATVMVDETAPADDTEGGPPSSPPAGLATASDVVSRQHLLDPYAGLNEAEHALNLARAELRERRESTLKARAAFAKALADWNAAAPIWTPEQQTRAYIETSNRDRAARAAAAGGAIVHPGITRTAKYQAGGNQRRGGGGAFRRGPEGQRAFSRADAMAAEALRLRAAAAARVKLPSEK